jgi:hypothetical protein
MKCVQLTRSVIPATIFAMRDNRSRLLRRGLLMLPLLAGLATGGCISVKAPDKPIVIELNINIKQEVVYRLAADAENTIDSNPDIF